MLLRKFLLLIATICLICSPACSETTGPSTDALHVRRGWIAPSDGYFLSDLAMRDTISGWTEAKRIADVRQQALEALRDEVRMQQADLKRQLATLQSEVAAERKLWRSRVRRGKVQGVVIGVLVGFTGGYLVRRNNP